MTEENYQKIVRLKDKIDNLESDIRKLKILTSHCNTVIVKSNSRFYRRNAEIEFSINDNEEVNVILRRILSEQELKLEELKKEFESL